MKKFLSLALALVMALSLFTVASAAEYKDLSDKDEITYSEAVAVLNKLGIIEGYEDGSFKPDTALNRAQAAKIMCGLLLTQATADKLTVSAAPFKDVAADYWAAAYISYCKNAGILDGYSDGTFKPTATLTGYQFCKMLLTALGYDSAKEGFVGRGWTLNVASKINTVGLTKGNVEFGGNSEVTREEACLYALNMLKATEVTYDGLSVDVSTGDTQVNINNTKAYNVVNNGDSDGNIKDDGYMQFAEEHFGALKISNSNDEDDFGRPSNTWSYRNVSFGTFAKQPDFVYTSGVGSYANNTEAEDAKALGLKGYKFATRNIAAEGETASYASAVNAVVNGQEVTGAGDTANKDGFQINTMKELAAQTGNGTVVEVYVDEDTADLITDVVVVKSQLMQINKVNSVAKTVSLKKVNEAGESVAAADEDNDYYAVLSQMKADDYVMITPVRDGNGYKVAAAYKPTTDTGLLTKVSLNSSGATNGVTVNGTAYKLAATKGNCFVDLNQANTVLNSKKDCTVYVDKYGYAVYIKDVDASANFFVYDTTYSSLSDGKIVHVVQGFDLAGNAVSLNVGTDKDAGGAESLHPGNVYSYTTENPVNDGEYVVTAAATEAGDDHYVATSVKDVAAGATKIDGQYFASGVKFVFINWDDTAKTDVKSVTVKDGVQEVKDTDMSLIVDKNGYVKYVVVADEASDATGTSVAYVSAQTGTTKVGTKAAAVYTLYIDGVETKDVISTNLGMEGKFVTYAANDDNVYTLKVYAATDKTTSVDIGVIDDTSSDGKIDALIDNRIVVVNSTELNAKDAEVIDLSDNKIGSISDIADLLKTESVNNVQLAYIYNGNTSASAYNTVSYLFVVDTNVVTD
ncbi:S-layer homology domain-containing protein [Oscillibacter sp. MSJ-2]|uniref:S-layer homology domain-containing protein n=1 Tax=Dysosmobacter acutus TaxID=2841504 RepID=A0ABS6F6K7_9FIRM|nr:S-layer homology domain-containing protein [Dysosmobacter acutus]MBU5625922.1 S-layer homology domain-containing protein [Dysosmobacter acutus]